MNGNFDSSAYLPVYVNSVVYPTFFESRDEVPTK